MYRLVVMECFGHALSVCFGSTSSTKKLIYSPLSMKKDQNELTITNEMKDNHSLIINLSIILIGSCYSITN